jgi:hypothetical protein
MQLDQMLHDRQPQSEAAEHARRRGVVLPETLEHMWQELGTDAEPGVVYA